MKWSFATSKIVIGSPAIGTDGTLYVDSAEGKLWALHPDGTQRWSFGTSRGTISSHAAVGSDGTVCVGCEGGLCAGLYAVNPDGSRKSHFPAADGSTNPVVGAGGMLYFASGDNVHGISTGSAGLADTAWPMFRQNPRHTGIQPGP